MKKPHTKARGILFAAAGMFLIPGSVSEVSAAERKDEQPFIQASGIESVLEKCYETEVKDNINLYLVPTEEGEYLNMAFLIRRSLPISETHRMIPATGSGNFIKIRRLRCWNIWMAGRRSDRVRLKDMCRKMRFLQERRRRRVHRSMRRIQ